MQCMGVAVHCCAWGWPGCTLRLTMMPASLARLRPWRSSLLGARVVHRAGWGWVGMSVRIVGADRDG